VSLDASWGETSCDQCVDTTVLTNSYVQTIGASSLWNQAPYLQGQSIGVAVVDSGISDHMDLNQAVGNQANGRGNASRVVATAKVIRPANGKDGYGHGTNVAGIIGGNGASSDGGRVGVAPKVNLVDVEVSNDNGVGRISDVIAGLQWVYQNHDRYNIRVVNLSLQSSQPEPYRTSPLDAAVEVLWFNRIVVVVAAGNGAKNGVLYPPANDPFVITVGATDDRGTPATNDDVVASFSAHGTTESGIAKPDLVAPGTNIISLLAERNEVLALQHPDHIVNGTARKHDDYFRMSGTSMSAAVTTGAVALLIQSNPRLTPDQVKNRLMTTARPVAGAGAGAGSLNISAAVASRSTNSSNTGLAVSRLLLKGSNPPLGWTSVNWESVNWESVNWESVNWESVNWESVNWESVNWESDVWN
jgi:serine protease AprX